MGFIKKFWIMEIALGLIAVGGVGIGVYNYASASELNTPQENGASLVQVSQDSVVNPAALADMDERNADEDENMEDANTEGEDHEVEGNEFEFDILQVAADLIGGDIEQLEDQLATGRALTQIAADSGLNPDQFVADLVAQELAAFDAGVQSGQISGEEAEEWREEISAWTPFWARTPYVEPTSIAAEALGIEIDDLWGAIDDGRTIKDLAATQGADAEAIIQAIAASELAYTQAMQQAGLIEAEEMSEIEGEINQMARAIVTLPQSQWQLAEGAGEEGEMGEGAMDEGEEDEGEGEDA